MERSQEHGGEDQTEYPTRSSSSEWFGDYGNSYTMSWQSQGAYRQDSMYGHPHTHGECYDQGYGRPNTNHGHIDFSADRTDGSSSSFYHFDQHKSMVPSQVPYHYHHVQFPPRTYGGGGSHQCSHLPPAVHAGISASQDHLENSAQQITNVEASKSSDSRPCDLTTTSDFKPQDLATKPYCRPPDDYAGSFFAHVQKFVARHREAFDLLVDGQRGSQDEIHHNAHSTEMYEFGEPDALEYHMGVEPHLRHSRFMELVAVGDVLQGHVTDKSPRELSIRVTSFVGTHKHRELSDIGIKGSVPFDNLADSAEKCGDILDEMELDDVIQAIVAYKKENGCLVLSFRSDHIEQLCSDGQLPSGVRVGYIEGRKPLTPRSIIPQPDDYLHQLEEDPGFLNPSSSDNLKLVLGIRGSSGTTPLAPGARPTLLKDFQKEEFPESDYCHALRKDQRSKWSMDTVAIGVKHFKEGENSKAMKYFDHALEIDESNVEGLVARGALFANDGKYKEGIADFEKALTLKHTHRNARNYLVQTQVAYGERLEKESRLEEAVQCYEEALADDPSQQTARRRLELITSALEKQAAEKRELERKKLEEKATLKKLQKLIEKEREKRKKKSKVKKSKRKSGKESKISKKRVSSKTKAKTKNRRKRLVSSEEYSSSESTDTESTEYSRSRSSSPKPSKQRRYQRSSRSRSRSKSSSRSPKLSKHRHHHRSSRSSSVSRSPKLSKHTHHHRSSRSRSRSRTRSRSKTPRVQAKQPPKPERGATTSLSDSTSASPSRKCTTKHKHPRYRQV